MTNSNDAAAGAGSVGTEISLSIREHNICFTVPFGARFEGRLLLPGGALIYGDVVGDIFCESGSIIIHKGGRFRGMAEADRIYIEGEVSSLEDEKRRSALVGRKMVAGSSNARINADIYSMSFSLHRSKVWGTLKTLEEANIARQKNRAVAIESRAEPDGHAPGARVRPKVSV